YGVAFLLELLQLPRPRPVLRLIGTGFGTAGLFAHTLFLAVQRPELASRYGSLLFLAWIVALLYLYRSLPPRTIALRLFGLALVVGLIGLAVLLGRTPADPEEFWLLRLFSFEGERFWGVVHGALLLLAAVGVCVGFLASVMYLVQARRLRSKALPGRGLKL